MPKGMYPRSSGMRSCCPKVWTAERDREVANLYLSGCSTQDIACLFRTNRNRIRESLRRSGTSRRSTANPGDKNPAWAGGRKVDADGYILVWIPSHPQARRGYVREHRIVAERALGRILLLGEVVHHKNGNKENNRPENLEVFSSNGEHLRHELTGKCPKWTEDGYLRMLESAQRKKERARIRRRRVEDDDGQ